MKSYRQLIAILMLFGFCGVAQPGLAGSLEEAMRQFQAQQAQQIRAQGANSLDVIQIDLQQRMELQRIAFMNEQRRSILRQGQRALVAIQKELLTIDAMPVLVRSNTPPYKGPWPAVAATTPAHDKR